MACSRNPPKVTGRCAGHASLADLIPGRPGQGRPLGRPPKDCLDLDNLLWSLQRLPWTWRDRMPRSRVLALVILCAASLMTILDGTIVTVALPAIQADLGFTPASLSWVMSSYLIAYGGLLLLSGRLGDLLGRRRMFLAGVAFFVLASLACGLAGSPGALIAARFAQGAGGAMASSVTLGMIIRLFDKP